jgi:putative nucleotidyltransferase with HDIG domain
MTYTRSIAGPMAGLGLSLVFALLLLGIQSAEFGMQSWQPGADGAAPISLRLPAFAVFRLHLGQPAELERRHVIIGRGDILEPNEDARLAAAYEANRRQNQLGWSIGVVLVSFVACLLLLMQMQRIPGLSKLWRTQATLLALTLVLAAGGKAFLLLTSLPAYYYPMPALVLLYAFLVGRRISLPLNLFTSTVFASLLGFDLSAFVVFFTIGQAGTWFLRQRKKRPILVQAGSIAGWFGAFALVVLMLVFAGAINVQDLLNPDYSAGLASVVGGVFSGLLAFALAEPVGWLTGRVSPAKLVELQDLDHPILKQIRDEAPGTWEHSRAAANLAEAAAAAIGADSLLVRVGAYVHDAGKALSPGYFIENQSALGITNPHDELEPEVSADCIFDHVREGMTLLRKHHVPEAIVEFAYTHHGTSLLEYFWVKNMRAGNPQDLKERAFHYPGMKPQSRETGILMIVDAVEAASRTIKEPAKHKFEGLVQKIVFTKLAQGQLDDSGLTLAQLKRVIVTLVDSLVNMYHARIEYPWQQTGDVSRVVPALAAPSSESQAAVAQPGQPPRSADEPNGAPPPPQRAEDDSPATSTQEEQTRTERTGTHRTVENAADAADPAEASPRRSRSGRIPRKRITTLTGIPTQPSDSQADGGDGTARPTPAPGPEQPESPVSKAEAPPPATSAEQHTGNDQQSVATLPRTSGSHEDHTVPAQVGTGGKEH